LSLGCLPASEENRLLAAPTGGRRKNYKGSISNRKVLTVFLVIQEDFFPIFFLFYPKELWENLGKRENMQLTTTAFNLS
jgi:hypothetical protein